MYLQDFIVSASRQAVEVGKWASRQASLSLYRGGRSIVNQENNLLAGKWFSEPAPLAKKVEKFDKAKDCHRPLTSQPLR